MLTPARNAKRSPTKTDVPRSQRAIMLKTSKREKYVHRLCQPRRRLPASEWLLPSHYRRCRSSYGRVVVPHFRLVEAVTSPAGFWRPLNPKVPHAHRAPAGRKKLVWYTFELPEGTKVGYEHSGFRSDSPSLNRISGCLLFARDARSEGVQMPEGQNVINSDARHV